MIIKKIDDVPFEEMKGFGNISKQIVIGPKDGSNEIILRFFNVKVGAKTPYHTHPFPHLVYVVKGKGTVTDSKGEKHKLAAGDHIYVDDNEQHCFENAGSETFSFYCTVPARGEN